jgi:hypothetical protein
MSRTDRLGPALIARAHNAIAAALGVATLPEPAHPELETPGATFVTLYTEGQLHGCVGSLEPTRTLEADVRANARAAAFHDPRFPPLVALQFAATRFEVSLIHAAEPIEAASESDVLRALVPHRDGVTLRWHGRRATLLPQVWSTLPDPRDFLRALRRKADLPAGFWDAELRLERYAVTRFVQDVAAEV